MIRVQQLKLRPGFGENELRKKVCSILRVRETEIRKVHIRKLSIDARKKPDIYHSCVVDVEMKNPGMEAKLLKNCRDKNVSAAVEKQYRFPYAAGTGKERPIIVGMGPAGLFCAYELALAGFRPILLERGRDVDRRTADVEHFWKTGELDPVSNVQFGEGGAGTFSDGKLNTLVKDRDGKNAEVLRLLTLFGAPEKIRYEGKPHVGTDVLSTVVKNMRQKILELGGEVRFETQVKDLVLQEGRLTGLVLSNGEVLDSAAAVLAIGHSARDTFEMLHKRGIPMEAKSFAVGMRVEHPQSMINFNQYAEEAPKHLPTASYKVTAQTSEGRGVYSFCMCPGGYVVNASSEPGRLAVNGMSYSQRDGAHANSAIIVSVTPEDYGAEGPLAGIAFQRRLEETAFLLANGKIPVQHYGEYAEHTERRDAHVPADMTPCTRGEWQYADLRTLFPESVRKAFIEGMESFAGVLPGFADDGVCLLGVESRTSSPVRIHRDENCQSAVKGLFPCGEGAGYAGGITSAAMDGMRVAEAVAQYLCAEPVN